MSTIFDDEKFDFNESKKFHSGVDRAPGSSAYLNAGWDRFAKKDRRPGASIKDWIVDNVWHCRQSNDCAANFNCIGGKCAKADTKPIASPGSGESTGCEERDIQSNNGSCGSYSYRETWGCSEPSCGDEGSREYEIEPRGCCGGPIYTRTSAIPGGGLFSVRQCEPFEDGDQCNNYCNTFYHSNGYHANGCTDKDVCICGGPCINGGCVTNFPTKKCYCKNPRCNKSCDECQLDGTCELDCKRCHIYCSGFYECPCGGRGIQLTVGQPMCSPGIQEACPVTLRRRGEEWCQKNSPCPPSGPGNSCTTQQVNGTTLDCECKTGEVTCLPGGSYATSYCAQFPPGAGSLCYDKGYLHVSSTNQLQGSGSTCTDGGTAVLFGKVCEKGDNDYGCKTGGCPTGQICNEEGFCETDTTTPTCNGPVCEGTCCSEGSECVPYRKYYVADSCHGSGTTFFAPQDPAPTLTPYEFITKEDSICGREHSHCSVFVGSRAVAFHLDCEQGLVDLGPAGIGCSSLD